MLILNIRVLSFYEKVFITYLVLQKYYSLVLYQKQV